MIEEINEGVDVLASFGKGGIRPRAFMWKNRRYNVKKVNFISRTREGKDLVIHFAVTADSGYFRLSLRMREMKWILREVLAGEG
jgi:hypothetical protein